MKQLTLFALFLIGAAVATAQTTEESYYWQTWIYSNSDARYDAGFPAILGNDPDSNVTNDVQWRGLGQVVNLRVLYDWFDEIYNEGDSVVVFRPTTGDFSDQDYIDQFLGARSFTIDTIQTWIYSLDGNAFNNTETLGALFTIMKTGFNFRSTAYISNGFHASLDDARGEGDVNVLVEEFLEPSFMAGNINGTSVQQTVFTYEQGANSFGPGESAIMLFWNPLDPAYSGREINARETNNGLDDQRSVIFAQTEFRTGDYGVNAQGQLFDTRDDSLTYYKALGLVLYRQPNGLDRIGDQSTDTLHSSWSNLFFLGRRSMMDMRSLIIGTVEIGPTGVVYHFGRDVAEQGLGEVLPNPVRTDARLPFSLNGKSAVTIELYSVAGEKITTLVDNQPYIGGNYTVPLPVSSLDNGTYMVRMTANENVYTMKFTVTK